MNRALGILLLLPRILLAIANSLLHVAIVLPYINSKQSTAFNFRARMLRSWAYTCRLIFGMQLSVYQQPSSRKIRGGCLIVSNHVSYWDAFTVGAIFKKTFLAKAEVQKIPILGKGARAAGLLFVERGSHKSRSETIGKIRKTLLSGQKIVVFPEGTTNNVPHVHKFNDGSFHALVSDQGRRKKIRLLPMAVSYSRFREHGWGNEPGLAHFLKSASYLYHRAVIVCGKPYFPTASSAREISAEAQSKCTELFAKAHFITGS